LLAAEFTVSDVVSGLRIVVDGLRRLGQLSGTHQLQGGLNAAGMHSWSWARLSGRCLTLRARDVDRFVAFGRRQLRYDTLHESGLTMTNGYLF
jgi:hypothetical protein